MRVDADAGKSEFDHVGLGDNHRASGAKPTHNRRVDQGGGRINEHLGPRARRLAGDIEQVLDANDRAIERTESYAGTRSRVGRVSSVVGGLRIDGKAGASTLALRVGNASESLF